MKIKELISYLYATEENIFSTNRDATTKIKKKNIFSSLAFKFIYIWYAVENNFLQLITEEQLAFFIAHTCKNIFFFTIKFIKDFILWIFLFIFIQNLISCFSKFLFQFFFVFQFGWIFMSSFAYGLRFISLYIWSSLKHIVIKWKIK